MKRGNHKMKTPNRAGISVIHEMSTGRSRRDKRACRGCLAVYLRLVAFAGGIFSRARVRSMTKEHCFRRTAKPRPKALCKPRASGCYNTTHSRVSGGQGRGVVRA